MRRYQQELLVQHTDVYSVHVALKQDGQSKHFPARDWTEAEFGQTRIKKKTLLNNFKEQKQLSLLNTPFIKHHSQAAHSQKTQNNKTIFEMR